VNFPKENIMIKSSDDPFLYNITVKIMKEIDTIHSANPKVSINNLQKIVENPCDWLYDNNLKGLYNVKDDLCLHIT